MRSGSGEARSLRRIDSYSFGEISIDGVRYRDDVIIFPDRVISGWWRESGHSLNLNDLEEVLKQSPETLIVGLGANARMQIPPATSRKLEELGIQVIALPTKEACDEFNRRTNDADVIAALHLTC